MRTFDAIALLYACPSCKAGVGEWCKTFRPTKRAAGARASWLHTARLHPIYETFGQGYEEGELAGMEAALENPKHAQEVVARRRQEREANRG